jgi:isopenicillin N synthase-like dioxygenase
VAAGVPLHGANLWPDSVPELRPAVLGWLDALRPVADAVLRAIAVGLGLGEDWFERHVTADPTVLFRIFRYPPDQDGVIDGGDDGWGVGEHTDYGLLTLLAQDGTPGLEIRTPDGAWIEAPADRELLIVNLGDMLEKATGGRYRSTPHRVRNRTGADRLSFPYFFDPSWDATVPVLPLDDGSGAAPALRWDGSDPTVFDGPYGDYLTAKVARVFPHLLA